MAAPALTPATADNDSLAARLNKLRAGVLGANDGIVSTAGIVFGVAGATNDPLPVLIAGLAGVVAGALSMAGGEYVSVSTQRDTERVALARQQEALERDPEGQLHRLAAFYAARGITDDLALQVATDLTEHDALAAHAQTGLGLDADERTSPWQAALASMAAFVGGALVPLLAVVLAPVAVRLPSTLGAVLLALVTTGYVGARLGGAGAWRPILRNVLVGSLAMGLTYAAGSLVGGLL
jgi:VIT1/CCC1 family predicted Fe2+/Mn2+ transporter